MSSAFSVTASTTRHRCTPPTWAFQSTARSMSRRTQRTSFCWSTISAFWSDGASLMPRLWQHHEVYHDGDELEFREHVFDGRGDADPAIPADAAGTDIAQ